MIKKEPRPFSLAGFLKHHGPQSLLNQTLRPARTVTDLTGKLTTGRSNVITSCLSHRRHNAGIVEYLGKGKHLLPIGLAQIRVRKSIEGNQIELAGHRLDQLDQRSGMLEQVVHPP